MFNLFLFAYVSQKHQNRMKIYFSTSSQFLPMLLVSSSSSNIKFCLILKLFNTV